MPLFGGLRASFFFGRAMGRFYRKKYEEAARLLEKVHHLDPETGDPFCHLGQCYLALGKYDLALKLLSQAYDSNSQRRYIPKSDYERRDFVQFLNAYGEVLQKAGQLDRAREVAREAEEYVKEIRKTPG